MKNLFFISILFLVFSCGGETKTETNTATTDSPSVETESIQAKSDTENPQNLTEEETTKVLAKNEIEKEMKPEKPATKVPAKNISAKTTNNSKPTVNKPDVVSIAKNEAEAKAQIEAEKAKAMAEKIRLEEEMKNAEAAKKAKEALNEKLKKEREAIAKKPATPVGLHDDFDRLLRKHVSSSGVVNYQGFKKDEARLDAYLMAMEKTNLEKSWGRNKTLAFWINAYNAFTIKLILKNYPIKSIMDLNNGKPWDVKWIKIDQRTLSLNNIENDIIRPKYNEPRIHFAVNCAAKSCPPLLNKAWTADNLNSNLERQTKSFINNSNYNTITSGNVEVSKIFDWYGKDFGDLKVYLNKYSNTTIPAGTSVNFKAYNWELNN
ncbi:MAG: DUF547 domain-containing protein [Saprospiraceae bacterium]